MARVLAVPREFPASRRFCVKFRGAGISRFVTLRRRSVSKRKISASANFGAEVLRSGKFPLPHAHLTPKCCEAERSRPRPSGTFKQISAVWLKTEQRLRLRRVMLGLRARLPRSPTVAGAHFSMSAPRSPAHIFNAHFSNRTDSMATQNVQLNF